MKSLLERFWLDEWGEGDFGYGYVIYREFMEIYLFYVHHNQEEYGQIVNIE